MKRKLTPHERLARAFDRETGLRLSADEVRDLVLVDNAIETIVMNILDGEWDEPAPHTPGGTDG